MTSSRRSFTAYFLMGPGLIWLILFFVVPLYFMGRLSLHSGTLGNFYFDWNFSNYTDSLSRFDSQFVRTFIYATVATAIALLIAVLAALARGGDLAGSLRVTCLESSS